MTGDNIALLLLAALRVNVVTDLAIDELTVQRLFEGVSAEGLARRYR